MFKLFLTVLGNGLAWRLGCFNDDHKNRVLPHMFANFRPQIKWHNMDLTIEQCAKAAKEHGMFSFLK